SVLVSKLPEHDFSQNEADFSPKEYLFKFRNFIEKVFQEYPSDEKRIIELFEKEGLQYLGRKKIQFHCGCSHEKTVENFSRLPDEDIDSLFEDDESLEVKCDYCQNTYRIFRKELSTS